MCKCLVDSISPTGAELTLGQSQSHTESFNIANNNCGYVGLADIFKIKILSLQNENKQLN